MRFIPVLLICVALATSAGCFGKDDENGGDPPTTTTPTGTGTTPTGATPTGTPTSPTADGNETMPPVAPMPKDLCAVSKNFQENTPDPTTQQAVSVGPCGDVTTGYTRIILAGNWTSAAPLLVQQGVSVLVVDAAGTSVASCTAPGPGAMAEPVECAPNEGMAAVGTYSLEFHGTGGISFAGSVRVA